MDAPAGLVRQFQPLDWLLLAFSVFLFVRGWLRGFVSLVLLGLGIVVGVYVAFRFTPGAVRALEQEGSLVAVIAIFLAIVLVVSAVFMWVGMGVRRFFHRIHLGFLDRVLGGLMYVLVFWGVLGIGLHRLFLMYPDWRELVVPHSVLLDRWVATVAVFVATWG